LNSAQAGSSVTARTSNARNVTRQEFASRAEERLCIIPLFLGTKPDLVNEGALLTHYDITEVQVDALTGQVLDVSKETVADQGKEKKEDDDDKADKK
jgi:hypothetical protein